MPIWKLEPIDPMADHWRGSKWGNTLFIRAEDEFGARSMAQKAFGIFPPLIRGAEMPETPWSQNRISTCEQVEDSEYDVDGPDDILGPEDALKRAHPRPW